MICVKRDGRESEQGGENHHEHEDGAEDALKTSDEHRRQPALLEKRLLQDLE